MYTLKDDLFKREQSFGIREMSAMRIALDLYAKHLEKMIEMDKRDGNAKSLEWHKRELETTLKAHRMLSEF